MYLDPREEEQSFEDMYPDEDADEDIDAAFHIEKEQPHTQEQDND